MMKTQNTKLKVTDEHFSMEIEMPWDTNIEEWKNVFVTVLTYKGFHRDTINELFYDEYKEDLIALKNNKKKKGAYTIAITCSGGTAIAGKYKAKSEEEAIKAAKAEHGDQWTYYVFENPDK